MGEYLLWMMRYSEALRKMLTGKADVCDMSYEQLVNVLMKPENMKEHKSLAQFLEGLSSLHLSVDERAKQLKSNYYKYFKAA